MAVSHVTVQGSRPPTVPTKCASQSMETGLTGQGGLPATVLVGKET